MKRPTCRQSVCATVLLALLASAALGESWPVGGHDVRRSRVTEERLSFPLKRAWTYVCAQAPRRAWPPPTRILDRMDFDTAPQLVVSDGILCFGSSADDTIRALDVRTGRLLWRFTTGGPVRFAPQIDQGRVYAGSDDGRVYCLDARTGEPVWMFRAAPEDDQYIGNGRMISRWPLRSGVLVEAGMLYCVAGMWPSEGIYVYALRADTGEVIWCNDTSGLAANSAATRWRPHDPHSGEFSFAAPTPQGALLASRDTLVVPLANNAPAAYSKATGRLLRFPARSTGGTWVTIDAGMRYTFLEFRTGLEIFGARTPDKGVRSRATRFGVQEIPQFSPLASRLAFEEHEAGKVSAIIHRGRLYARRAFGLALVGGALIEGRLNAVVATDPETEGELWRAPVGGKGCEIAVADGRLFVATDRGEITCFGTGPPAGGAAQAPRPDSDALPGLSRSIEDTVVRAIREAGSDRGFALVLGDARGAVAGALAEHTGLHVISAHLDEGDAAALRDRLLTTTDWYGSRIHVVTLPQVERLPYAQYFANAVVLAGPVNGLPSAEVLRVLRPCGGILLAPGLPASQREALWQQVGALGEECETRDAPVPCLIRRRLSGARDWDVNVSGDRRVRWPLRPIWFGGPAPELVMNVGIGSHPPVAADGRYFVTGQSCLTAVDAYNGTVLWRRPIPSATPNIFRCGGLSYQIKDGIPSRTTRQWTVLKRWVAADAENAYLRLGHGHFRDRAETLIRIDARNGRQEAMCGAVLPRASISLATAQSWRLKVDEEHWGEVTLENGPDGPRVALVTRDAVATKADVWDLGFDFRPAAERFGLYDRGAFMIRIRLPVDPGTPPGWGYVTGRGPEKVAVTGRRTEQGTEAAVTLAWAEVEKIAGRRPSDFGFAAVLTSCDGEEAGAARGAKKVALVRQNYLFCGAFASGLTSGWATVVLAAAEGPAVPSARKEIDDLGWRPAGWLLAEETVKDYVGDPGRLDEEVRRAARRHPLTGEPGLRGFRSGTAGCGNPVYSAAGVAGRTNKLSLGFYDFADDSGLHFFQGISPNCGARMKAINMTAALGLLIFSNSRSHCDCMIPVRTSLAFAPAEKRLNEDWAIFFDRNLDAPLRRAHLNFGAFGDRRDGHGDLWLAFPRRKGGKAYPIEPGSRRYMIDAPPISGTMQVPMEVAGAPKARRYRFNADRFVVEGTDRPWIYASGYRGIGKAALRLAPVKPLVSLEKASPIIVDGEIDDDAWRDGPQVVLAFTGSEVFLRHDADHLYVAVRRKALIDRRGEVVPWTRTTHGEDAEIGRDDAWEIFLSDAAGRRVVHLGVAASGARYDALAVAPGDEDPAWDGQWQSAVVADEHGFAVELSVPWSVLREAGLNASEAAVNLQMCQKNISLEAPSYLGGRDRVVDKERGIREPLVSLGPGGSGRCTHFVPLGLGAEPQVAPRHFTVRLHFAEPDGLAPGARVFDVLLQGKTVLKGFDVAKAAEGRRRAVVREFGHIAGAQTLTVAFVPAAASGKPMAPPVVSGLEVIEEGAP